jgi:integrase
MEHEHMNDTTALTPASLAGQLSPHLAQKARQYVINSKSAATLRAYAAHWRTFAVFCEAHGVQALPATAATVCAFLTTEAERHRAATLTAKLSAIAYMHRSAKQPNPCDSIEVKEMLAGIRRTIGTAPRRKKAITVSILRKMLAALPDGLRGKRDRAILLVGWASAMRRSELAAMRVEDVTFTDYGARILIPKSKTDQEGEGQTVQLERGDPSSFDSRSGGSGLCPVSALRNWLSAAGIQSGNVFRGVDMLTGRLGDAITGRQIARIVKDAAERVGESAHEFAGHSMRAGFVTSALAAGAGELDVMEQTRHTSAKMLKVYSRQEGKGARRALKAMLKSGEPAA